MKPLLSIALLTCAAASGFSASASIYDATDAASQAPFHNGGHLHALWLRDFATDKAWIFDGGPGSIATNGAGDIEFTGNIVNLGDASLTAMIDFAFTPAASGSPKKELTAGSYTENGGIIDTSTWTYWDFLRDGTMSGSGALAGLEVDFTQRPDLAGNPDDIHGQLGVGANGKNANLGYSAWLTWTVVGCVDVTGNNGCTPLSLDVGSTSKGDINIDLSPVPLPAAFWLFGSAIFALVGLRRKSTPS